MGVGVVAARTFEFAASRADDGFTSLYDAEIDLDDRIATIGVFQSIVVAAGLGVQIFATGRSEFVALSHIDFVVGGLQDFHLHFQNGIATAEALQGVIIGARLGVGVFAGGTFYGVAVDQTHRIHGRANGQENGDNRIAADAVFEVVYIGARFCPCVGFAGAGVAFAIERFHARCSAFFDGNHVFDGTVATISRRDGVVIGP